jgi:hypothetical protein
MAPPAPLFRGPWNDWTKTDFGRAKIKLTGHFDRGPIYRFLSPVTYCSIEIISYSNR